MRMPKVKKLRKAAPEREYIVEKITGKRIVDGCVEYSIKWKGYPMSENTWEKEEDCNCSALIREFETNLAKSDGGAQPKVKGPSKKAQAKVTENNPAKGGFNRGLEPEAILGATEQDGKLIFLMKWYVCIASACTDEAVAWHEQLLKKF